MCSHKNVEVAVYENRRVVGGDLVEQEREIVVCRDCGETLKDTSDNMRGDEVPW